MTTIEPDEQGRTTRIEHVPPSAPPSAAPPTHSPEPLATEELPVETRSASSGPRAVDQPASFVVGPANPQQHEVVFVPLAVNVGDGFKFGCGFFLALVLVMLTGFVLVAALFVLTGLFGLNLPITR